MRFTKQIFVVMLTLFLNFFFANAQEKVFLDNNLVPCDKKDASYYELDTDLPDQGLIKARIFHLDGSLYQKGYYQTRGVPERSGTWMEYHTNGEISSKRNYSRGKIVGIVTNYYPNGDLHSRFDVSKEIGAYMGYLKMLDYRKEDGEILIRNGNGRYNGPSMQLQNTMADSLSGEYKNGKPYGKWIGFLQGKEVLTENFDEDGFVKGQNLVDGQMKKYDDILTYADFGISDGKFNWDLRKNFAYYYEIANPNKTDYKIKMNVIMLIDNKGNITDIKASDGIEKETLAALLKAVRRTIEQAKPALLRGVPVDSSLSLDFNFESRLF
jgi:antitoxin component YwqK of YwqJK toxin-antitoxin module